MDKIVAEKIERLISADLKELMGTPFNPQEDAERIVWVQSIKIMTKLSVRLTIGYIQQLRHHEPNAAEVMEVLITEQLPCLLGAMLEQLVTDVNSLGIGEATVPSLPEYLAMDPDILERVREHIQKIPKPNYSSAADTFGPKKGQA